MGAIKRIFGLCLITSLVMDVALTSTASKCHVDNQLSALVCRNTSQFLDVRAMLVDETVILNSKGGRGLMGEGVPLTKIFSHKNVKIYHFV